MKLVYGLVGAAMVAVLATGSAQAAYNGCVNIANGKLRKLTIDTAPPPTCSARETPVVVGGAGTCHSEEFTSTAQANTFAVLNATCATGTVTGAGAIWATPFDAADNGPFYIYPRSFGPTWTVIPYNHTASASDFRFVLWCCE